MLIESEVTQNKFEGARIVATRNRTSLGGRAAIVVLLLPFFLSSCQPVAAGLAGVGVEIFIVITTITMMGFGIQVEKQKNLRLK